MCGNSLVTKVVLLENKVKKEAVLLLRQPLFLCYRVVEGLFVVLGVGVGAGAGLGVGVGLAGVTLG